MLPYASFFCATSLKVSSDCLYVLFLGDERCTASDVGTCCTLSNRIYREICSSATLNLFPSGPAVVICIFVYNRVKCNSSCGWPSQVKTALSCLVNLDTSFLDASLLLKLLFTGDAWKRLLFCFLFTVLTLGAVVDRQNVLLMPET